MSLPGVETLDWKCKLGSLESPDLVSELKGLTVGQSFRILCEGDPVHFDPRTLTIETKGAEEKTAHAYQLKLIKINTLDESKLDAVVSSFEVGKHEPKDIVLKDSTHSVELSGLNFELQSVIKEEQGQKAQPFGIAGPLPLSWSWLLIAPILIGLLLFVLILIRYFRQRLLQKNWNEQIAGFKTARRPIDELLSAVRAIDRAVDFSTGQKPVVGKDLRELYDIFLIRTFSVPAHIWSPARTMRAISKFSVDKKDRSIFIAQASQSLVQRTMIELRSLQNTKADKIPANDIQQVVQLMRKSSDLVVSEIDARGKS